MPFNKLAKACLLLTLCCSLSGCSAARNLNSMAGTMQQIDQKLSITNDRLAKLEQTNESLDQLNAKMAELDKKIKTTNDRMVELQKSMEGVSKGVQSMDKKLPKLFGGE